MPSALGGAGIGTGGLAVLLREGSCTGIHQRRGWAGLGAPVSPPERCGSWGAPGEGGPIPPPRAAPERGVEEKDETLLPSSSPRAQNPRDPT